MKLMISACRMLLFMTVLTVMYSLAITGLAQALFPKQANGSMIEKEGKIIGSQLIGQKFEHARYFWSRPSSVYYNPLPSGGSNQGQASEMLRQQVSDRTATLKNAHGNFRPIPQDLLFSSASGLDPHISIEAAKYQMERVAKARGLDLNILESLIAQKTTHRTLGFFGEPTVNVLELNLEMDRM